MGIGVCFLYLSLPPLLFTGPWISPRAFFLPLPLFSAIFIESLCPLLDIFFFVFLSDGGWGGVIVGEKRRKRGIGAVFFHPPLLSPRSNSLIHTYLRDWDT